MDSFERRLNLSAKARQYDVILFDGTYEENGKNTLDLRARFHRENPDCIGRTLLLVGIETLEFSDKKSQFYKRILKTNYVTYTNKLETACEWLLAKAKELGRSTERIVKEYEPIREEMASLLKIACDKNDQVVNLLQELYFLYSEINEFKPQNATEMGAQRTTKTGAKYASFMQHDLSQVGYALGIKMSVDKRIKDLQTNGYDTPKVLK